jgi:hypothetical protein
MPAGQPVATERFREPCGRLFGYEILTRRGAVVAQAAADNLFHLSLMEVDARAEAATHNGKTISEESRFLQAEGELTFE